MRRYCAITGQETTVLARAGRLLAILALDNGRDQLAAELLDFAQAIELGHTIIFETMREALNV